MNTSRRLLKALSIFSFLGFVDAAYLTIIHYQQGIPPCLVEGCETVLTSSYATVAGIPIALLGALYYMAIFFLAFSLLQKFSRNVLITLVILVSIGFAVSLVLLGIQLFVLDAICQYCIVSIVTTTISFILGLVIFRRYFTLPSDHAISTTQE
jgi:uncharacterized membrane protein